MSGYRPTIGGSADYGAADSGTSWREAQPDHTHGAANSSFR